MGSAVLDDFRDDFIGRAGGHCVPGTGNLDVVGLHFGYAWVGGGECGGRGIQDGGDGDCSW